MGTTFLTAMFEHGEGGREGDEREEGREKGEGERRGHKHSITAQ
jgi:hypothetical protein